MQLYSVDVRGKDNNADPDRGRNGGLNSPFGNRGAICAHYGWTWEYLHQGIAWAIVQRMLADAPNYTGADKDKETKLTNKNKKNVASAINSMI